MVPRRPLRLFISSILLITSTLACATVPRTFVASFGDDTHPCSIAQPCRGLVVAVSKTNPGGEVIVLDSAGYGPVTITKSISIIAPSGVYAGISVAAGNGIAITAPGATVVLRGLSINGQGGANGILVQQAAHVRIESCVISNMGAQGIYHQADNAEMIVLDTISRDNGDGGIALVAQDASIVLDHVRSEHNVNVGFYMAPVVPGTHANAAITESTFVRNGGNGIWADSVGGANTNILVQRSVLSGNAQYGFYANAGAGGAVVYATLTRNSFDGNGSGELYSLGILPGRTYVLASENAFLGRDVLRAIVHADGDGSNIDFSGNAGRLTMLCDNGANFNSFRNNSGAIDGSGSCSVHAGFPD